MKKISLLKGLVAIVLSLVLVVSLSSFVFADDNSFDVDGWDTPATTNNAIDNGTTNDATNTGSDTATNDWASPIETNTNTSTNTNTGSATTTLDTNDTNEDNEVNSLAYTGIEDTNFLAIFVVLSVIVAAYSFKKVKEYNTL